MVTAARKACADIALISDTSSIHEDYDMELVIQALSDEGVSSEVVFWDQAAPGDIADFGMAVVRSPWSYFMQLGQFMDWVTGAVAHTRVANPPEALFWSLDKRYIISLAERGVATVPSVLCRTVQDARESLKLDKMISSSEMVVIKPTVGAYSHGVKAFVRDSEDIFAYCQELLSESPSGVILQPMMGSVETDGEINAIFFQGIYSHAIAKPPLIDKSTGIAGAPTQNRRRPCDASSEFKEVAVEALQAAASMCGLGASDLLYARVDMMRRDDDMWAVHEIELCEPSLSLAFSPGSADKFAVAVKDYLKRVS